MGNESQLAGAMGAAMGIYMIFIFALSVLMLISEWKIFVKANEPGVAAIVPFWNTAVLCKITWGKWYYMFFLFIPIANIVFSFISLFKLAKAFGKDDGFGIGLIFLSFVFMPMLAFGNAAYAGVPGKQTSDMPGEAPSQPVQALVSEPESPVAADVPYESIPEVFPDAPVGNDAVNEPRSTSGSRHWNIT